LSPSFFFGLIWSESERPTIWMYDAPAMNGFSNTA
jgi:hypothetical protein